MTEKHFTVVSIICATLGPISDVAALIRSVITSLQVANAELYVEFILVDQSLEVEYFSFDTCDQFRLVHIRNSTRGLSVNRNIGLDRASGNWVMFLDSDCLMSEDFFNNFLRLRIANPTVNHFMGRILDPMHLVPLFRIWPNSSRGISKFMLWYFATSVNNIYRLDERSMRFDESFGLGAKYGSSEDIDFYLRLKSKCLYVPELVTYHPDNFKDLISIEKKNSYSYGFGALCAKHFLPFGLLVLASSLLKKTIDVLCGRTAYGELINAVMFRLRGFLAYLYDKCKGGHV